MSRRGNGEGSVPRTYTRSNGQPSSGDSKYRGQIYVGGHRRTCYGPTPAAVRQGYRELVARHEAGAPLKDAKITVKAWVTVWSGTSVLTNGRRQSTVDAYRSYARNHIVPAIGELAVGNVRKAHLDALLLDMERGGLAASTRRVVYATLRDIFREAVANKLVKDNPMAEVKRPAREHTEASFLSPADATTLLAVLGEDPRLEALVRLMLLTGMRSGEALGLSWELVDLDAGKLYVRQTLNRTSAGLALGPVKSDGSRRDLDIDPRLAEVLRGRRKAQAADRLSAPVGTYTDSGLVFTTALGHAWEPRTAQRRFAEAVKRAGLPSEVHLHTLRHSAASLLLAAGVSMKEVQAILGHANYAITADIYSHILPEAKVEAMRKLGEALGW